MEDNNKNLENGGSGMGGEGEVKMLTNPAPGRTGFDPSAAPIPPLVDTTGARPGLDRIKEIYVETYGDTMEPEQVERLFKMAQSLKITENDGIWLLLLGFENYWRVYTKMPWAVEATTRAIVQRVADEAQHQAETAAKQAKADISKIARQAASGTNWKRWLPTIAAAAIAVPSAILMYYTTNLMNFWISGGEKPVSWLTSVLYNLFK